MARSPRKFHSHVDVRIQANNPSNFRGPLRRPATESRERATGVMPNSTANLSMSAA